MKVLRVVQIAGKGPRVLCLRGKTHTDNTWFAKKQSAALPTATRGDSE